MTKTYTVINIIRIYDTSLSFIICLQSDTKEYYKVHKSLSERISKGMVYIGDTVKILMIESDGIIFEVEDSEQTNNLVIESDVDFFYSDNPKVIKPTDIKSRFLPFLCDVLPYSQNKVGIATAVPLFKNKVFTGKYSVGELEVSNIKLPIPQNFIAKIHQKTRINTYPTSYNPFFFVIVSSNNIFLKIVFWSESLKDYSSLKVGDIVMIKDFKQKKKWTSIDKIDVNTFTESVYFDVDEITAKEVIKVKYNKKTKDNFLFESIEGEVEYLSILMRCSYNGSLMEYLLMKIDGKKVVLFYNSDPEFYKINLKSRIKINELRKINRAGCEIYVSTIYTQFERFDTESLKKVSADDPMPKRRKTLSDDSVSSSCSKKKTSNKVDIIDNEQPIIDDVDLDKNTSKSHEEVKTLNKDVTNSTLKGDNLNVKKYVFGAVGFIPDNFLSVSDILDYTVKENINGSEVLLNLFMKPVLSSIPDLKKVNLILNESKKFIVNSKITKIVDVECIIDYVENDENKKQGSFAIVLEDEIEVFVYDNFFNDVENDYPSLSFKKDTEDLINIDKNFIIEAFRADESNVLYYLTGILKN